MKKILESTNTEVSREYFYDLRDCYSTDDFSREILIKILLNINYQILWYYLIEITINKGGVQWKI